ncbi:hypothetical protein F2Q70_00011787 [Brassica cretica]|uniref:Secreted protein n=1 Tax=Brassica cretica TaxID=69181 RepID=A0A8S9LSE3_BRACR|nr:hypothetical protein F2Q70_00011787 [Brassica cretica]
MLFSDFFWLLSAPAWVSHSQHFMMSFNDASKLFSAPAWASHSLNFLDLIFPCFPRRGVFFRGISGYIARKSSSKVCWNLGSGTWELGSGTWKLEPGTQRFGFFFWMNSSGNICSSASFMLGSKSVTTESMSESPQNNRILFKTSKAEQTNSRNGSPGELDHDTSQLARRAQPCCRWTRRRARPRHEPARPASTPTKTRRRLD